MVSAVDEQHIRSNRLFQMWDHDPGGTGATIVSPDGGTTKRLLDGRDIGRFAVLAYASVLAGNGITKVEIIACTDAAGSDATVIKDSGVVAADALGDWLILECAMDEVSHLGDAAGLSLRYIGARITCQNAGDEAVVVYYAESKRRYKDLTPATTIAS